MGERQGGSGERREPWKGERERKSSVYDEDAAYNRVALPARHSESDGFLITVS